MKGHIPYLCTSHISVPHKARAPTAALTNPGGFSPQLTLSSRNKHLDMNTTTQKPCKNRLPWGAEQTTQRPLAPDIFSIKFIFPLKQFLGLIKIKVIPYSLNWS